MVRISTGDGTKKPQAEWHKYVPAPKYLAMIFIGGILLWGVISVY